MKTYYLKDEDGCIISKFEMTSKNCFEGKAYECISWNGETNKPIDWHFHSEVYAKWDGCSHWWFYGEDYNPETNEYNHDGTDSYYHICSSFENFIRIMCFIWKLAGNYHITDLKQRNILTEYTLEEYNLKIIDFMLDGYEIVESFED